MTAEQSGPRETATLGGGCFWCLEAVYDEFKGVERVVSGYAGGQVANPSYEQVCSGRTGHAETGMEVRPAQVRVHQDHALAHPRQLRPQRGRQQRLADAALASADRPDAAGGEGRG